MDDDQVVALYAALLREYEQVQREVPNALSLNYQCYLSGQTVAYLRAVSYVTSILGGADTLDIVGRAKHIEVVVKAIAK